MSKIKKPIYGPPEIDETTMTEYEVSVEKRKKTLHKIRERKIKKAFKTYRFRGLKNFLFWFFGVMSSIGIIFGSIFVGVKVIPISTYLKWSGQDSSEIVSENISEKSVFDAIMSFGDYTFSDVPVIETVVKDLLAETGMDEFVVVDYSALKDVKFLNDNNNSDLMKEVSKCVKLSPDAQMFSNVKAFKEHVETASPLENAGSDGKINWAVKENVNASLYCYASASGGDSSPANAKYVETHTVTYEDVVVDGKLNEKLKKLNEKEMANVVFYYKPLYQLPLLDIVDNIDVVLDRVEIAEVISLVEKEGDINPLITNVLNGLTIGKLTDEDFEIESLFNNLKLNAVDGISEILGEFGGLKVFSDWQKVDDSLQAVQEKVDKKEANPALYYYQKSENPTEYARAFKDDGSIEEGVAQDAELFYPNLLDIPVSELLSVIGDSFGTLEITELFGMVAGELSEGDMFYEILKGMKISDLNEDFDIMDKVTLATLGGTAQLGQLGSIISYSEMKVVPEEFMPELDENGYIKKDEDGNFTRDPDMYFFCVEKEGEKEYFRAFDSNGKKIENESVSEELYYASGWEKVAQKDIPELDSDNKIKGEVNPALYYYLPKGADETDVSAYQRTFNDDGSIVSGANVEDLYYANLDVVKFSEIINVIGDSIGRKKITDLLTSFGANISDNELVMDILGDRKISEIDDITADDIKLISLFKYESSKEMYKLILSAKNMLPEKLDGESDTVYDERVKVEAEKITISMLQGLTPNNINLDVVLPESSNADLYKIIRNAKGLGPNDPILISTLTGLEIDDIQLSTVLDAPKDENDTTHQNKMLYDILLEALVITDENNKVIENPSYENIRISHLSKFNFEKIDLNTVLPESENASIYSIIRSAKNLADNAPITIETLKGFNINNVSLEKVLLRSENADLYEILDAIITPADQSKGITVGDLGGTLTFDNITLNTVMPYGDSNKELYDILLMATGKMPKQGAGETDDDYKTKVKELAEALTIGNIKGEGFDINNVYVYKVFESADDMLIEILSSTVKNDDGETVAYEEITLGMLKNFNTDTLLLDMVLPYYDATDADNVIDNKAIYKILVEACGLGEADDAESLAKTLTVEKLKNFSMDNLSLSAVLDAPKDVNDTTNPNKILYDIMLQALTITDENGKEISNPTYKDIKISHLGKFSTTGIKLGTVMGSSINDKLKTVLMDACDQSNFDDITFSMLYGESFKIERVKLKPILTDANGNSTYGKNTILDALMQQDDVTIGNIGEKINGLYLSDVYPVNCFTTTDNGQAGYYLIENADGIQIYVHEDKASGYELTDSTTKYYVSKEAHIWLFLHYGNVWDEGGLSGYDDSGNAYVYVDAHHTLSNLQEDVDHISDKVTDATIRQLVDAGIVTDTGFKNSEIYAMSLSGVIDLIGNGSGGVQ